MPDLRTPDDPSRQVAGGLAPLSPRVTSREKNVIPALGPVPKDRRFHPDHACVAGGMGVPWLRPPMQRKGHRRYYSGCPSTGLERRGHAASLGWAPGGPVSPQKQRRSRRGGREGRGRRLSARKQRVTRQGHGHPGLRFQGARFCRRPFLSPQVRTPAGHTTPSAWGGPTPSTQRGELRRDPRLR